MLPTRAESLRLGVRRKLVDPLREGSFPRTVFRSKFGSQYPYWVGRYSWCHLTGEMERKEALRFCNLGSATAENGSKKRLQKRTNDEIVMTPRPVRKCRTCFGASSKRPIGRSPAVPVCHSDLAIAPHLYISTLHMMIDRPQTSSASLDQTGQTALCVSSGPVDFVSGTPAASIL